MVEGIDQSTGNKIKILVTNPTKEIIIQSLLRQAANGNMKAIEIILDRIEGSPDDPIIEPINGAVEGYLSIKGYNTDC